jgi:hypothetical protein
VAQRRIVGKPALDGQVIPSPFRKDPEILPTGCGPAVPADGKPYGAMVLLNQA